MHITGRALKTAALLSHVRKEASILSSAILASECFPICFRAGIEAQYAGKFYPVLCLSTAAFQVAYSDCAHCLRSQDSPAGPPTGFAQFIEFCSTTVFTVSAPPVIISTTTTPLPPSEEISSTTSQATVSTEIITSVLTSFVATLTEAGSTATFRVPNATVYQSESTTTKTVRFSTSPTICPSLAGNAGYTATTSLATDYTWGCPPGYVCQPHQQGCNYPRFPAENYSCPTLNCAPVSALPTVTPSTLPFPFVKGYVYLDPADFGLDINQVFDVITVETSTKTIRSTHFVPPPTTSAGSTHKPTPGMIAGATVSSVAGLALIIALLVFFLLRNRRRRKQAASAAMTTEHEKAQLHSDDVKPVQTELDGGSRRKPVPPRELAANEEPTRALNELPANEVVGSEMESSGGMGKGESSAGTAIDS